MSVDMQGSSGRFGLQIEKCKLGTNSVLGPDASDLSGSRKAQAESRAMGAANVYSINGQLYYELPDGKITRTQPQGLNERSRSSRLVGLVPLGASCGRRGL